MSELRQNLATREWVILASERASFVTGALITMDGAQRKAIMDV